MKTLPIIAISSLLFVGCAGLPDLTPEDRSLMIGIGALLLRDAQPSQPAPPVSCIFTGDEYAQYLFCN